MMKTRGEILCQLADFREPSEPLLDELRKFGWDTKTEHFIMTQGHVHSILKRYLDGELTAERITSWAESFESRDDVAFGESKDGNLKEKMIFIIRDTFQLSCGSANVEIGSNNRQVRRAW
jgi:hypothetical protein